MCETCMNWERTDIRMVGGKPVAPNHHPNCPHYNDSLIDVWKIEADGKTSYTDNQEDAALAPDEYGATVTAGKMHREVYDNLPEFEGF